jgi:serine phosphatase RsbU (regulator of sigma subunit)/PAS domain-containing protein
MNKTFLITVAVVTVMFALILLFAAVMVRQRRRFRALFDNAVDGLAVVDQAGVVLFLNRAAPRLLRRSRRALKGKLFIAPSACGEVTEISVEDKSGQSAILEIRKGRLTWRGRSAWLLQFRDVTRRRELEDQVRRQEARFQAMTANVPGVVYQWIETKGGGGQYSYISPRCTELLGVSAAQLEQEWRIPRLFPRGTQHWQEALNHAADPKIDWSFERQLTAPDGHTRWLRDLSRPQVEDDQVLFNGVLIDVTAEKKLTARLEQARQEAEQSSQRAAERNREMQAGINYASRIQQCILPDATAVISQFSDAFIYLRPRDVVSGDFYWFSRVGDCRILICADCTGHGVPGAFMTLLGNDLFEYVVNQQHILTPGDILEKTDHYLGELTGGSTTRMRDGMVAAVCCIENRTLRFAGARLPLYRVTPSGLEEIRGTRRAIGDLKKQTPFREHAIDLCGSDTFYLATDGFSDQFGGANGGKYLRGRFRALLQDIAAQPMQQQPQRLNSEFEHWKQNQPQVDDVLVIGFQA